MTRSLRESQLPGALAAVLVLAAGAAFAQSGGPARDVAGSDLLRQRDHELEAARAEQKRAIENEKKLRAESEALGEDRRKFNQALIDGAAKVKDIEKRLTECPLLALSEPDLPRHRCRFAGVKADIAAAAYFWPGTVAGVGTWLGRQLARD